MLAGSAGASALAQQPVQVTALAAPDAFSTPGRATGLPPELWRGASLAIVKTVLPVLAARPLSPAAAALARRVLASGAQGPDGAGADPALTAARASALMAQADPKAAAAILARAPGADRSPALARAIAETALLAGDDARACAVEEGLVSGRDEVYWLRLRTLCQAIAGHAAEAQLTFDLAQAQANDPVFARLMGAKLAGGDPGAPALRNGLDYALSRRLGLDLSEVKAAPAVAAAFAEGDPAEPHWDLAALPPELAEAAKALLAACPLSNATMERLLDAADASDAKLRPRLQAASLLVAPFAEPLGPALRGRIAALPLVEGRAPAGRNLALEAAASDQRMGEAALLTLWTSAEAGPGGLAPGDRARIVRSLHRVGLEADARAFALEGLASLK